MKKLLTLCAIALGISTMAYATEQAIETKSEMTKKFYCGFSYGGATIPTATLGMRVVKDDLMFDAHVGYRYFETDSYFGKIHIPQISIAAHALFNNDTNSPVYAGMGTKAEVLIYHHSSEKNDYWFYPNVVIGKIIPLSESREVFVEMCYIPVAIGRNDIPLIHTFETHLGFSF